jgi:hypothetical protein
LRCGWKGHHRRCQRRDRSVRCRRHRLQLRGPHNPASAGVVLLNTGRMDLTIVLCRVGRSGSADKCCDDPGAQHCRRQMGALKRRYWRGGEGGT